MPWPTSAAVAIHPFGTGLFWDTFATANPGVAPAVGTSLDTVGSWAEVAQMTRVTAPERAPGDTRVTHLKSPSKAQEYIPGWVEGGTLTCRLHHSPATMVTIELLKPTSAAVAPDFDRYRWAIQFANGVLAIFTGYIKGSPVEVSDGDEPVAIDLTIKVSGDLDIVQPA